MKRTPLVIAFLCIVLLGLTGCAWMTAPTDPALQANAAQTSQQLAAVQAAQQEANLRVQQVQAIMAALPSTQQVVTLQTKIDQVMAQLGAVKTVAATQPTDPALQAQVTALNTQVTDLKTQLAAVPGAATVEVMQKTIKTYQEISDKAAPILAALQRTSDAIAKAPTNGEAVGNGIIAAAPAASLVPGWGVLITLALTTVGGLITAWTKNAKANQTAAAATSIVKSVSAAASAGGLTITQAGIDVLNAVQSPEAKDLVTAIQEAHSLDGLAPIPAPK